MAAFVSPRLYSYRVHLNSPSRCGLSPGQSLETCCLSLHATIAAIQVNGHHRMPVILRRHVTNHPIPVTTAHCVMPQGHGVATPPGWQYLIRIRGRLGATALSAFPTMGSEVRDGETLLTGSLEDRSAVYGVLAQLEALGLEILELRQVGAIPPRHDP